MNEDNEPVGGAKPKRKAKVAVVTPVPLAFHHRQHSVTHERVWRSDWEGDQFEVIDNQSFNRFKVMLKKFGVPMIDKTNDDD